MVSNHQNILPFWPPYCAECDRPVALQDDFSCKVLPFFVHAIYSAMLVSFPLVSFVEKLGNNKKNASGDNNRLKTQETSQFLTQPL